MRRAQGTSTWSLLTEEYVRGRDNSRMGTFVMPARSQLPLEDMRFEHVHNPSILDLPNARIDIFAYWMDEEAADEYF